MLLKLSSVSSLMPSELHPPSGAHKKHTDKRRALLIVPDYACDTRCGGGQRTQLMFQALKTEFLVDVLIVSFFTSHQHSSAFVGAKNVFFAPTSLPGEVFPFRFVRTLSPSIVDRLATLLRRASFDFEPNRSTQDALRAIDFSVYGVVAGRYLKVIAKTGVLALKNRPPLIVDIDDRDDHAIETSIRDPSVSPIAKLMLKRRLKNIKRVIAPFRDRVDHLWVASESDRKAISHRSVSVLPNIPFDMPTLSGMNTWKGVEQSVLFVGSAGHHPNVEGVGRFIKNCWPYIAVRHVNARFRIVGIGGWEKMDALAMSSPRVDIVGACDDLSPEYARASFCVSPVNRGAGTKIKVLEALAFNRAVVVSKHSTYGFSSELLNGPIITAENDQAMIEACDRLLSLPEECRVRASRGRQLVLKHSTRDHFNQIVLGDCKRLANRTSD